MSPATRQPQLFLLGQLLSELNSKIPLKHRRGHVCGHAVNRTDRPAERDPWVEVSREAILDRAAGPSPPGRVALVCDAGLGKTTNLAWLQARLADRRRLSALLRLDS